MCIEPERTCGDSKLSDKEKKKTRVVLGTTQTLIHYERSQKCQTQPTGELKLLFEGEGVLSVKRITSELMKTLSIEVLRGVTLLSLFNLSTCPSLEWANLAATLTLLWVVVVEWRRDHKPLFPHIISLFEHRCKSILAFLSIEIPNTL